MNLQQAKKTVGHSITQRTFLRLAGELGLNTNPLDSWTEQDVADIRAARTFSPSLAGRQIGLKKGDFEAKAAEIDLSAPWTHADILGVRDHITPIFDGLTSDEISARMGVTVEYIRRYSRDYDIGVTGIRGCYMVDGVRQRFGGDARKYQESDIAKLRKVLPEKATQYVYPVPVSSEMYQAAFRESQARGPLVGPADVLAEWLADGGKHALPG